jgi:peptidoglycan/xylan/chitin deacetylase (PgdA/CDA1 family)
LAKRQHLVATTALLALATLLSVPASAATAQVTYAGTSDCRDIAFTFDAEFSESTPALVKRLDELGIRATFFFKGDAAANWGALMKQIAQKHQIGNHSFTHPQFTKLTPEQMRVELTRAEEAVVRATGKSTKPFFRPPYGDLNQTVKETVAAAGYTQVIMWSSDPRDWEGVTAAQITATILREAKTVTQEWHEDPIVVMHGSPKATADGMAAAYATLKEQGYQFVTIAEMLDPAVRAERDWGGERYWVQLGDTPAAVAACHNVSAARLMAYNGLKELVPGVEIQIPQRDEVIVRLNGERLSFPVRTRLVDGRTMVHVRLAERLGATVAANPDRSVTVSHAGRGLRITFQANSDQITINGRPTTMVRPSLIENDRMLVPLQLFIQQFSLGATWNQGLLESSLTN